MNKKQSESLKHVQHELRLLLLSSSLWELAKERDFGFVVNVFRDSALVHFRTLIKFFLNSHENNDMSITVFDIEPYESKCRIWIGTIDEAILHVSPNRLNPNKTKSDLNDQIGILRDEILALWMRFINDASPNIGRKLIEALNQAEEESRSDLEGIASQLTSKPLI